MATSHGSAAELSTSTLNLTWSIDQHDEYSKMSTRLTDSFPDPIVVVWPKGGLDVNLAIILSGKCMDMRDAMTRAEYLHQATWVVTP
jgi:hypothetical protein